MKGSVVGDGTELGSEPVCGLECVASRRRKPRPPLRPPRRHCVMRSSRRQASAFAHCRWRTTTWRTS